MVIKRVRARASISHVGSVVGVSIKAKLSIALEVLSDIKHVLNEDAGLAINFEKTKSPALPRVLCS
jgi:hypothetical protein